MPLTSARVQSLVRFLAPPSSRRSSRPWSRPPGRPRSVPGVAIALGAALAVTVGLSVAVAPPAAADCPEGGCSRLGIALVTDGRTTFDSRHLSGVADQATALQNIHDTAAGLPARRSGYGGAPGGTVYLDKRMLTGLSWIASAWRVRVTELAGGAHSPTSYHYAGRAVDIGSINGFLVNAGNPYYRAVMDSCRRSGAVEVLGPGDPGHSTHVHCAW